MLSLLLLLMRKGLQTGILLFLLMVVFSHAHAKQGDTIDSYQADVTNKMAIANDYHQKLQRMQSRISSLEAESSQLDVIGPRTNELEDQLSDLRIDGPTQIESFRERLKSGVDKKHNKIEKELNRAQQTVNEKRQKLDSAWKQMKTTKNYNLQSLVQQGPLTANIQKLLDDTFNAVTEKEEEKSLVISELKQGLFCSQCDRSKHEVEKEERMSFKKHLRKVNGRPVARPEKIIEKEKKYDQKIESLKKRMRNQREKIVDLATKKHEHKVKNLRKEVHSGQLKYDADVQTIDAALVQAKTRRDAKQGALVAEKKELEKGIRKKETAMNKKIRKLGDDIQKREADFEQKKNELAVKLQGLKSQEEVLIVSLSRAKAVYRSSLRKAKKMAKYSYRKERIRKKRQVRQARSAWIAAERGHQYTVMKSRRAWLDSRNAESRTPNPKVAEQSRKKQKALNDYQRVKQVAEAEEVWDEKAYYAATKAQAESIAAKEEERILSEARITPLAEGASISSGAIEATKQYAKQAKARIMESFQKQKALEALGRGALFVEAPAVEKPIRKQSELPDYALDTSELRDEKSILTSLGDSGRRFYDGLPEVTKARIQKNIEKLRHPVNTIRASIKNRVRAFKNYAGYALLKGVVRESLGRPDGSVMGDIADSLESSVRIDPVRVVKRELMGAVDDLAVEGVVAMRSKQAGREFSEPEKWTERAFARAQLFGTNLNKHFKGLLKSVDETFNGATTMLMEE